MEKQEFSLGEYLAGGIERIVKRAVRATLTNPRESVRKQTSGAAAEFIPS